MIGEEKSGYKKRSDEYLVLFNVVEYYRMALNNFALNSFVWLRTTLDLDMNNAWLVIVGKKTYNGKNLI